MARVLVVDDEADIRRLVRYSLELDGHDVIEASDGVAALRALDSELPDVVVLDITMPRLGGWDVLAQVKASSDVQRAGVPVIVLTAAGTELDRIRAGIEGAVRYLVKPFDPDDLCSEVRGALDRPDPEQRRRAALDALEHLAALERGGPGGAPSPASAHPHVTRLGGPVVTARARARAGRLGPEQVKVLSSRQYQLLRVIAATPTVLAAAERLGVSRSNVYASLRRIARRLDVPTVTKLVALAREGVGDDAG